MGTSHSREGSLQKHAATTARDTENAKPDEPAQTPVVSNASLSSSFSSSSTPPRQKKVNVKRKMTYMQARIDELESVLARAQTDAEAEVHTYEKFQRLKAI